jgi:hypothetical protein
MAGLLTTGQQIQTYNFTALGQSTILYFDGFNSALGTLNSVHFEWTMDKTVNNVILNNNLSIQAIGDPIAVSATSTTTFLGSGIAFELNDINTLTTPGYTGNVAAGAQYFIPGVGNVIVPTPTTVGAISALNISGGVCLSNDASCGAGNTNLSSYIGGSNLFNIAISNSGNQGGSVPPGVFTGNTGTADGVVSLFYDYSLPANIPNVPEPASLSLMGLGLAYMTAIRRKKAAGFLA